MLFQLMTAVSFGAGVQVSASAPGSDGDAAGLLQVRIAADDPAAASAVAALAAGVVKGALPGGVLHTQSVHILIFIHIFEILVARPDFNRHWD